MTVRILHTADLHLDSPLRSLAMKDDRLAAQERLKRWCSIASTKMSRLS